MIVLADSQRTEFQLHFKKFATIIDNINLSHRN